MDNPDLVNDVRFLRDVVARTEPPRVNYYWPVTLSWGIVVSIAYMVSAVLGMTGKTEILPWVWPVAMGGIAMPLHWYFVRRVRRNIQERGVRPRFRKDLMCLWLSITLIGLLWTAGLGISGMMASHWYVLAFSWGGLYFVGYMMNGALISNEWFWAAGVMLASLIAAFLAGPGFYWLPGLWVGGTFLLAGLLGRRNVRRQMAQE
jgi:hypothetical protein